MHYMEFDSPEAMRAFLAERTQEANAGLAPAQQALSYGDCWVQFHDIANRHIVFGRVLTKSEVAGGEITVGRDWDEIVEIVKQSDEHQSNGYLYGYAYDRFNTDGELGTTHKSHVWPIEHRLFDAAGEAGWEIANLDDTARVLLDLAFRQMRAHVLPKYGAQS